MRVRALLLHGGVWTQLGLRSHGLWLLGSRLCLGGSPTRLCQSSALEEIGKDDELRDESAYFKYWAPKLLNPLCMDAESIRSVHQKVLNRDIAPDHFHRLPLRCHGCGSYFHSDPRSNKGFLRYAKLQELRKGKTSSRHLVCEGCFTLRHYHKLSSSFMPRALYNAYLGFIRDRPTLVLYVIDVVDTKGSLMDDVDALIGHNNPTILVFNKMDLLPKDGDPIACQRHIERCLEQVWREDNSLRMLNVIGQLMVSCKEGFGVKNLLTAVRRAYTSGQNVVILGSANAGKSSLFNLLQDAICLSCEMTPMPSRSTVCELPGTTGNLVRFPLSKRCMERLMVPYFKDFALPFADGNRPLDEAHSAGYTVDTNLLCDLNASVTLEAQRESLNEHCRQNYFDLALYHLSNALYMPKTKLTQQAWLYDTPSVVSEHQIWHHLSPVEAKPMIPTTTIHPKSFKIPPGYSVCIAGLARIDLLSIEPLAEAGTYASDTAHLAARQFSTKAILSAFVEHQLPCFTVPTHLVPRLVNLWASKDKLKVPRAPTMRATAFPVLQPTEFSVVGTDIRRCASDILLASSGWLGVAPQRDFVAKLRVWTPFGGGVDIRTPALVPQIIMHKGTKRGLYEFGRWSSYSYGRMKRVCAVTAPYHLGVDSVRTRELLDAADKLRLEEDRKCKLLHKEIQRLDDANDANLSLRRMGSRKSLRASRKPQPPQKVVGEHSSAHHDDPTLSDTVP